MNKLDLAYAAGFFDGEGSVTITRGGYISATNGKWYPSLRIRVAISNTNPVCLKWLHRHFGGSIRAYEGRKPHHRRLMHWHLAAAEAVAFLTAIRPYTRMKAEQIDIALHFQTTRNYRYGRTVPPNILRLRERLCAKIRALNHRQFAR